MADRGRDLKFNLLSDISQFDTDKPAHDLDDLGDAAGRVETKLGDFEDTARQTARRVVDAFQDISKGSRKHLRDDVEDDLDKAGQGLDEFKDEAKSSGREAAASFGGGFDDITSFVQETAANAFAGFGVIGAAAGTAAALGIGIIGKAFGDAKESAEEARSAVSDWIQAYVDGLGTIQEATIQSNLSKFAEDGGKKLREMSEAAKAAGVNVADYQRAQAGDIDAQRRVAQQYQEQAAHLAELSESRTADQAALSRQGAALQRIAGELGYTNTQMAEGKARADELRDATNRPISMKVTAGIVIPTPKELDAINRQIRSGIGEIPVQLRVEGQSRYANTTNNSRYRN